MSAVIDAAVTADYVSAQCTIVGTSNYSQSHQHSEDGLEGESPDAYDQRTWRSKMNVETNDKGKTSLIIPSFGLQMSIVGGAKFSKKQIPGHGKSTWTKRFEAGISVVTNGWLDIDPDAVKAVALSVNADGVRGSGRRVIRRFPQIPAGWKAHFNVLVLDTMITEEIFVEMLQNAGLFVGVGQFRPEKGGTNGRFIVEKVQWHDARQFVQKRRATS